ncbi:MAG: hypothetical protein JWO57_1034 [Pseudonocardiales bacterium]|nr:hypothetical protein [Pseudonocardiales bacterium]
MDRRLTTCRFGPDRRLTAAGGVLAAVSASAAALTTDRAGQILFALAALVLAAYAVTDLLFWPRLTASAEGLAIRTPSLRARLPWPDVDSVRADSRDRYGLRAVTLEIEAGDSLVVFSRRALGADPETVAGLVTAFDPRR